MAERQNRSESHTPKRGLLVRILILIVAGLMLAGVVAYPFLQAM